jgi:hypothetical protein
LINKKIIKTYDEGIRAGLGKPSPVMEKLISGEEYHFIYVFKIGQNRTLFIAQNKHRDGAVFYCEINDKIKLTVNRENNRCPKSGTVYRVKIPSKNTLIIETIETRR